MHIGQGERPATRLRALLAGQKPLIVLGAYNAVSAKVVEAAGFPAVCVAAIHIEDHVVPKRCGHVAGRQVIPIEEAVGKFRAADKVRRAIDPDFVFSTDYPHHDSEFPHSVDEFLGLPIAEASKRKILWDNCARFYGIG